MSRAEILEAEIRRKMAEHAAIEPRGYDTQRRRREIHDAIDKRFDEWRAALNEHA